MAYESHWAYLGATVGCMLFQAMVIVFLLLGWHRLDHPTSLDPFEIARALDAPLLDDGGDGVQDVRLRYGRVLPVDGEESSGRIDQVGHHVEPKLRLRMEDQVAMIQTSKFRREAANSC